MMKIIPYVGQNDLVRWKKSLDSVVPKIANSINSGILQSGRLLALNIEVSLEAGALAYALDDLQGFFSNYKEGVWRFQLFFDGKYSEKVDHKYIYEMSEEVICSALIIHSLDVWKLGEQILPFLNGRDDARSMFIAAMIAILSGDMAQAREIAQSLIERPEFSIGVYVPLAILAIAAGDLTGFLEYLRQATIEYDNYVASEAIGTPEAVIFVRGAALLRLFELVNDIAIPEKGLDIRLVPITE